MVFRSSSTEHLAFDSSLTKNCCKMETILWKLVTMTSLIIAFIALVIGITAVSQSKSVIPIQKKETHVPASCKDVNGPSGVYTIQPLDGSLEFKAYCDMESVGGGWTLVASVHENNIYGKCTAGDKWSSEQGTANPRGSKNWENRNAFGQLETITNQDYKNPAYYDVPAENIMLWHVPNEVKIYQIKEKAFLKYYTTNSVLKNKTLQWLYKTKIPVTTAVGGLHPLIKRINDSTTAITSRMRNWYNYRYDGGRAANNIRDGGGDMYDGGNKVSFATDRENFTQIVYNTPYFLYGSGLELKSGAGYPFIALAWIGSGLVQDIPNPIKYFDLKVQSNYGADGQGAYSTYKNQFITQGAMTGMFTAFNVVNATDPSVCEVFFYIASRKLWKSILPSMKKVSWGNTTRDAVNIVRFSGAPSNLLIGYTLLSKVRGVPVSVAEVEMVLRKYMIIAGTFSFKVEVPHIVAPISYIQGDNATIMSGIPMMHKNNVVPGYIQFRAFNSVGLPNALCPGIRVNSDNPEQMCIGGTSTAYRDVEQCGDFAGWSGIHGDPGKQATPSRTGKSQNDINSSILIFTR